MILHLVETVNSMEIFNKVGVEIITFSCPPHTVCVRSFDPCTSGGLRTTNTPHTSSARTSHLPLSHIYQVCAKSAVLSMHPAAPITIRFLGRSGSSC